jgi:hypothetical protein
MNAYRGRRSTVAHTLNPGEDLNYNLERKKGLEYNKTSDGNVKWLNVVNSVEFKGLIKSGNFMTN